MQKLYLSRRNLRMLLLKLDRNKANPGESAATIIKTDTTHSKYPSSDVIAVTAVEDEDYYTDRNPGRMYRAEEEALARG